MQHSLDKEPEAHTFLYNPRAVSSPDFAYLQQQQKVLCMLLKQVANDTPGHSLFAVGLQRSFQTGIC